MDAIDVDMFGRSEIPAEQLRLGGEIITSEETFSDTTGMKGPYLE